MGSKFRPPTFGPYPPTIKSKISENIGPIFFGSKIPSEYAHRRSGKIYRVEKIKTHGGSIRVYIKKDKKNLKIEKSVKQMIEH